MYLIRYGKTRLDAFAFAIRHRHCQARSRVSCRSVAAAPSPVTKDSTHHLAAMSRLSGTSIRSTLPIQLIANATFVAKARSIWSTVVQ